MDSVIEQASQGSIGVHSANSIRTITLQRPSKRNAMTASMCADLAQAWQDFRDSDDRVAILTGEGAFFCAGADLTNPPSEFWRAFPEVGIDIGKPVIAALNGPAIGLGVGILMFCDLVVAAQDAYLLYPEAKVGISKGMIAAMSVRVPHKIAMELMLLAEPISAQRAYDTGMINRVVGGDQVLQAAQTMAQVLAKSAPKVIRMLKGLVAQTLPLSPVEKSLQAQRAVEACTLSQDAQEGLAAFAQKRRPEFKDQ